MANLYETLQRGRQEAAPIAPALPRVAKPSPAVFGLEMRTLSSRLQPLFDDRKPVTLAVTASSSGEGVGGRPRAGLSYRRGGPVGTPLRRPGRSRHHAISTPCGWFSGDLIS
jgi:hypothetical protein